MTTTIASNRPASTSSHRALRSPLNKSQREDLIAKHVIVDRKDMAAKLTDTKRFICYGCKFATDDETRAANHQAWVRERFENDARELRDERSERGERSEKESA